MSDAAGLAFLRDHRKGVLATIKRDGRPQLSNVIYAVEAETGRVLVSVTADRAKTRNADRDPRVGLHVTAPDFGSWIVVEGDADLTPVAANPDDASVDALVELYRSLAGEHPDWAEYRAVMVEEQRQVLSFAVTHAYGRWSG